MTLPAFERGFEFLTAGRSAGLCRLRSQNLPTNARYGRAIRQVMDSGKQRAHCCPNMLNKTLVFLSCLSPQAGF